MVMPLCGTFHYAGVVPDTKDAWESGQWTLKDQSCAARLKEYLTPEAWKFWKRDPRWDNNFDRVPTELGISRAVDLAHAACAEGGENLVRAESDARSEGHCRGLYGPYNSPDGITPE
jgi:hypothetical protein